MWSKKQLSDVCTIKKGSQVNRTALSHSGDYYVLNGGMEPSGYLDRYNTEANTISISEGGNSCGYVAYNTEPFWSGGHNYTLSELEIEKLYLYYFLKCNESKIMNLRVGSGLPNIQRKMVEAFPVYYPVDIKEQRCIATVLTSIDEAIAASRALVKKFTVVKQGLMHDLLGKGELNSLADLADSITRKGRVTAESICLNMDCIESGSGRVISRSLDSISSDKIVFKAGDVLFAKLRPYLRKYWLADLDGLCSSEFLVFKAKPKVRSKYLYYIVSSNEFVEYNNSQTFGTKMPRTSWSIAKKYQVRVPNLDEQDRIIEILTAADERLTAERERLRKLENIKVGLMGDLLTNRVSTDKLQGGI